EKWFAGVGSRKNHGRRAGSSRPTTEMDKEQEKKGMMEDEKETGPCPGRPAPAHRLRLRSGGGEPRRRPDRRHRRGAAGAERGAGLVPQRPPRLPLRR